MKVICKVCNIEICRASMARHYKLYHPLLSKTIKPKMRYMTIEEVKQDAEFSYDIKGFSELKSNGFFDFRVNCKYYIDDNKRTQSEESSITKFVRMDEFHTFLKNTIKRKGKNSKLAQKVLSVITAIIESKDLRGDKKHECPICLETKVDHQVGTFFNFYNKLCSKETHRVCEKCYNLLHTCCPMCRATGYYF